MCRIRFEDRAIRDGALKVRESDEGGFQEAAATESDRAVPVTFGVAWH